MYETSWRLETFQLETNVIYINPSPPSLTWLYRGKDKRVRVASIKTALKSNYSAVKNGTCQ